MLSCLSLPVFNSLSWFPGGQSYGKTLTEEMNAKEVAAMKEAVDEGLAEMKRVLDEIQAINERMASDEAEIERLKRETRAIHARVEAFINAHFNLSAAF